jgi:hypothetical protein
VSFEGSIGASSDDDKTEEEEEEVDDDLVDEEENDIPDIEAQFAAIEESTADPAQSENGKILLQRIPKGDRIKSDSEMPMPATSQKHIDMVDEIVQKIKEDQKLEIDSEVVQIMRALDMELFYCVITEEHVMTTAMMLHNAVMKLTKSADVLSLPLNLYFNVCICFLIGDEGSVACFGHVVNVNMIRKSGLGKLLDDQRLIFSNSKELNYGKSYGQLLETGIPELAPYDVILLCRNSDSQVSKELQSQLHCDGICYNPTNGVESRFA